MELAKNKNKKKLKHQRKYTSKPKKTPAISNNTINAIKKKKKRNTNKVIYFNCNKKDYYASDYTKLKN